MAWLGYVYALCGTFVLLATPHTTRTHTCTCARTTDSDRSCATVRTATNTSLANVSIQSTLCTAAIYQCYPHHSIETLNLFESIKNCIKRPFERFSADGRRQSNSGAEIPLAKSICIFVFRTIYSVDSSAYASLRRLSGRIAAELELQSPPSSIRIEFVRCNRIAVANCNAHAYQWRAIEDLSE